MDQGTQQNYMSYQAMVNQINVSIASLEQVCGGLELTEHRKNLDTIQARMKEQVFSVGIMGEFRRGKSTVINALLGQEIVPSDIVPTSATLNYIRWDAVPRAVVHFKDGTEKQIDINELSAYVTKITAESKKMSATVEDAQVYYPCSFCRNGVQIIDTPGLNDDERMTAISERVIPTLDAIVMVLVPDSPFSQSEADFVRTKVMTSDLGRIIFVVNKIDNVRKKDRQRLLDSIKEKIQISVLDRIAAMYGENSDEYVEAKSKVAGIRICGISARDALEGRLDGDDELVERSGIHTFEEALSHLLTVERGMLELAGPVNSVLSAAKEARKSIAFRRNAVTMDKQELEQITAEAQAAIEDSRTRKMAEVSTLKNQAATLYANMLPELDGIYGRMEQQVSAYVDDIPLDPAELGTSAAVEDQGAKAAADLDRHIRQTLSEETDKLLVRIQSQVGDDVINLRAFSEEMASRLESVQGKLAPADKKSNNKFEWGVVALDSLIPVVGIGGFLSGWKENGLPGALVGGGIGLAAGGAAYLGTLAFCGSVLGMATVAALPVFMIAGIASTFGGKAAVKAIFKRHQGERNVAALRTALHDAVSQAMKELRGQRILENWLKDTTSEVYNSVANQIDVEIETTLTGFAQTLNQIALDRQKKENEMANTLEDLAQFDYQLDQIAAAIGPVKQKMAETLDSSAA